MPLQVFGLFCLVLLLFSTHLCVTTPLQGVPTPHAAQEEAVRAQRSPALRHRLLHAFRCEEVQNEHTALIDSKTSSCRVSHPTCS